MTTKNNKQGRVQVINSIKSGAMIFFKKQFVKVGNKGFYVTRGTFIGRCKHPETSKDCMTVSTGGKSPILLKVYWSDLLAYSNPIF